MNVTTTVISFMDIEFKKQNKQNLLYQWHLDGHETSNNFG